jgi:uncharacterized protein YegJ (DUF2314 family)
MNNISNKISNLLMIGIIAIVVFVLFGVYVVQDKYEPKNNQSKWDENNTRLVDSNDILLNETKRIAQLNLPYFISEFKKNEDTSQTDFYTKIKITEDEQIEHIWIYILSLNENSSVGLLSNVPKYFKKLKFLDTISFDIKKAEDLMIMKNDSVVFGQFSHTKLEEN